MLTLKNALRSLWLHLRRMFGGEKVIADSEKREGRVEICSLCPCFRISTRQCSECGCFVDVKAALEAETCPRDYWRNVGL